MRTITRFAAGVLVALAVAGCGGDGDDDAAGGPFGAGDEAGDTGDDAFGLGDEGDPGDDAFGLGEDGGTVALPTSAQELVETLYGALAVNDVATACALFSPTGLAELSEGTGMPGCGAAVDSIAQEVVDPEAFAHPAIEVEDPDARELDEWCGTGISVDIPDGAMDDWDALAAFGYTRQPDGTWLVTSYNTTSCGG